MCEELRVLLPADEVAETNVRYHYVLSYEWLDHHRNGSNPLGPRQCLI